jgi:CPA1 family monovalent cation:H+ antiporter
MSDAFLLVTFLSIVIVLSVAARRFKIPYPISFVIGGVGLAFARNLPHPHFDPDIILLIVLPPLLYSAAWSTDASELRRNWRPISLLAFGLVIFTTVVVAAVVHALVPGFGWPVAFVLGAIVSPPDAVAAEAIFERLSIPRRVSAIILGECLVNDATALVLYRFAVVATVSGAFSLARAGVSFLVVAVGGALVGLVGALVLEGVLRYTRKRGLDDPTTASIVSLLAPYAAYLPAEELHCSGVLAAVTAGIVLSWRSRHFLDSETRVQNSGVWRVLTYILNAFAFLLIGLQLPAILLELEPHVRDYALYGALISLLVIVIRLVWVFPATYVPRMLSARLRAKDPPPPWQAISVIGWSGMRGIVSLAAALALPYTIGDQLFPERGVIIFFTVCVVLVTLVLQGLTLSPLIERLGVTESSSGHHSENRIRIVALEAGMARLRTDLREHSGGPEMEVGGRLIEEYRHRIDVLRGKAQNDDDEADVESRLDRRLQCAALEAERSAITRLRESGQIPDDIFRSIEYDLDLAALRLN